MHDIEADNCVLVVKTLPTANMFSILRKGVDAMTMKSPRPTLEPMPQPPVKPTIDNMEEEARVSRFMRLAHTYGPIFQLNLPGRQWVITANYELANELCDEKRFLKKHLPLRPCLR